MRLGFVTKVLHDLNKRKKRDFSFFFTVHCQLHRIYYVFNLFSIGSMNAAVLPVPVWAQAIKSLLPKI